MSSDVRSESDTRKWYHGSPTKLSTIRTGSTITQDRDLARVFSHKPSIVSVRSTPTEQSITHNGTEPGFLYVVAEDVGPEDVYPHPRSTMDEGKEALTRRELRVTLREQTAIKPDELLSEEQVRQLMARARRTEQ